MFHVEQKLLPILSYYHISICSNFFIGGVTSSPETADPLSLCDIPLAGVPSMTNFFTAMREKFTVTPLDEAATCPAAWLAL